MDTKFCPYCMTPVAPGQTCSACGLTAGNYSPAPHHLPPGTVLLDRYLIGRVLGEGGFGITYIGCDLRLEMKVAIKEFFPTDKATRHSGVSLTVESYSGSSGDGYASGKTKFLREARTMARMNKQRLIVGVRDFFEANNTAYIVMEYVEGTTFKELVRQKGGRIPAGELLHLIEPLFPALDTMHQMGLIHRDISPDNLMLENGEVRLLDFGCARESSQGTQTMTIALKRGYAPIEQYQHKGQGPWTDVYALCSTIYYCLTGKVPPQALDRLCGDELILPRKLGVDLTENQERALLYGMGIRPAHRYRSVQELYAALYTGVPAPMPRGEREYLPPLPQDSEMVRGPGGDPPSPQDVRTHSETENPPAKPPEAPDTPQTTDSPPTPTRKFSAKRGWIAALGAVAACGVAALALGLGSRAQEAVATVPAPAVQATSSQEQQTLDSLFSQAATLTADENGNVAETDLRALLDDEGISSVILPAGSFTHFSSLEPLVITKPVLLEEGAFLTVSGQTFLSGPDACLYVKGDFSPTGIVRTEFGGRLVLADLETADISTPSLLLLEHREDLVQLGQGVLDVFEERIVCFDQDAVFAGATTVSSEQALNHALDSVNVSAIRIEGDVAVTTTPNDDGYRLLYCSKPLYIAPGATLTVIGGELYLDNDQADAQALLVNEGTLHAGLNTSGHPLVINRGTWEGGIFGADATVAVNEQEGVIRIDAGFRPDDSYNTFGDDFQLYNLGQLSLSGSETQTVCDVSNVFFNYGTCSVGGNAIVRLGGQRGPGTRLWNYGSLLIGSGGEVENWGYVRNDGAIEVADDGTFHNGAALRNSGYLLGTMENGGVFLASDGTTVRPEGGLQFAAPSQAHSKEVLTGAQLRQAAEDPAVTSLLVASRVVLEGDFTLTKPLILAWGGSLTVTGTLTVDGTCLLRECNDGVLKAQSLVLVNGAAVVQEELLACQTATQALTQVDSLLVSDGCAYIHGAATALEAGDIQLSGCNFLPLASVTLSDGVQLTVQEGASYLGTAPTILSSGTIVVEEGGYLWIPCEGDFGSGVTLTNYGDVSLCGRTELTSDGIYIEYLPATVVNYGAFHHGGNILYLTGSITNHGSIYAGIDPNNNGASSIQIGPGGSLSGKEILQYDGSFDWRQS